MILNGSRAGLFQQCRQKLWNWDELKLQSYREADPLMIGNAFHVGMAKYYTSKNTEASVALAEEAFRKHLEGQTLLAEELPLMENHITLVKRSIEAYARNWKSEPIQVLMPEVRFRVPLPNSEHHCFFVHRLLHGPDEVANDACQDPLCRQSHFFAGRTDAVVEWNGQIWLLEHKTTAKTGNLFFDRFLLDTQPTGYLYGIWKSTTVRPSGFILNVAKKPYANAADPFAITFEREPYTRTEDNLLQFEREVTIIASEFERAIANKLIFKNTHACVDYNRRCYYFDRCVRGDGIDRVDSDDHEFRPRPDDYVNEMYLEMLGLEKKETTNALPPIV
jgi:hypothetical protein